MKWVRVSDDGTHFVRGESNERFVIWGVNYDHDSTGRLLDEYWIENWEMVVEDFSEIKALGANCVRVHLQFGKFMNQLDQPNPAALDQLTKLIDLAERSDLYLNITGLACYHKQNIPPWFDKLDEAERWSAQAHFWRAVSDRCKGSPAVFCYDLINEPILPGKVPATEWLTGELDGKFFVQRLALELKERTREQIASAWVRQMTAAIKEQDNDHLITVGVIPWVFVFGRGKPVFYSDATARQLDFVSIHVYPKQGEVDQAIAALDAYDIGKPILIEETFPLKCSEAELKSFIQGSKSVVDGWCSFYWGVTAKQLRARETQTLADAITASWLDTYQELATGNNTGQ